MLARSLEVELSSALEGMVITVLGGGTELSTGGGVSNESRF